MLFKALPLFGFLAFLSTTCPAQDVAHLITLDGKTAIPGATEKMSIVALSPGLEIYPAASRPSRGTILIAPGGGYVHVVMDKEGHSVARMLNEAGWDAAVLFYHTNVGEDTRALALKDATRALTLLQTRGGEFGLATTRVGVMGFSAGGHLVARLAHETAGGKPPAFLVLMYPAYLESKGRLLDEVAPINAPVFLYIGEQDQAFLPGTQVYDAACKEKSIRCEFTVAHGVGHGFGLTSDLPAGVRDWPEKLRNFLASLDARP